MDKDFRTRAPRNSQPPVNAIEITTFKEHAKIIADFFKPRSNVGLIILLGRPGINKSYLTKQYVAKSPRDYLLIKGSISAPKAYERIWECSLRPTNEHEPKDGHHKTIILDDAESLANTNEGRILLRSLTETDAIKQVGWEKQATWLENKGIPCSFQTKSRCLIIANRFNWGKADEAEAILSRSHFYFFNPSALEVHTYVGTWYWDQEIYDYVATKLHLIPYLNCRPYILAWELKSQGSAWKPTIDRFTYQAGNLCPNADEYLKIKHDKRFKTIGAKIAEFMKQTGTCRKTWYNVEKFVIKSGYSPTNIVVPKIKLKAKPPKTT